MAEEKKSLLPNRKEAGKENNESWQQEVYTELKLLAAVLTVTILVFHFLTQLVVVVGGSMYPTLHDGDLLIAWRAGYEAEAGDIVVLHKETEIIRETIVKRVIATGGQTVEIDYEENAVYVDGVRISEPYLNQEDDDIMIPKGDVISIDVPEGCVFVMGDNRNHSTDSRHTAIGCVDTDYILGKVILRVLPVNRISSIK